MFRFMRMEDLQMLMNSGEYLDLVQNIKQEIQSAQVVELVKQHRISHKAILWEWRYKYSSSNNKEE